MTMGYGDRDSDATGAASDSTATGLLRLSAVAAEGFGDDEVTLAEVTLRAVDPAALDAMIANAGEIPATLLSATLASAHDVDGEALPWRLEGLLASTPDEVLTTMETALAEAGDLPTIDVGAERAQIGAPSSESYSGPPTDPFEAVASVYLPLVGYVDGN